MSWRILLAEDNPMYQRMIAGILEKRGHRVCVVGNGREALAALERESFSLVLMDLEMPEMGGLEATASIRANERATGNHLPILAVTTCVTETDQERCRAAGMDGHLAKPVQAAVLLKAITNLLERDNDLAEAAPQEDAPEQPFDYEEVLSRVDGDRLLLHAITQMFLEDCSRMMGEIHLSIERSNAGALRISAHTMRGAVANFSAAAAERAAHTLETMGRRENFTGAEGAFLVLEEAIQQLLPALHRLAETTIH